MSPHPTFPSTTKVNAMRIQLPLLTCVIAASLVGCGDDVAKQSTPANDNRQAYDSPTTTPTSTAADRPVTTPAADNTAKNQRDDGTTLTPIDQGMSETDTAITSAVRKAVVAEPDLSVKAQNAKIITKDGVVTLRGPVASSNERTTIMTIAERTPGVKRVDNQLEVVTQ